MFVNFGYLCFCHTPLDTFPKVTSLKSTPLLLLKVERLGQTLTTPNAFVSSKFNWHSNPNRTESSIGLDKSEITRQEFKPFVSEGFAFLESSSSQVPIKILRDTGATQSLLLEGVLPFY